MLPDRALRPDGITGMDARIVATENSSCEARARVHPDIYLTFS